MAWSERLGQPDRLPITLGEKRHARRIPVQEIPAADRSDLALREKSREGDRAKPFRRCRCIVVRSSEQTLPPAAATEQEGPKGRVPMRGSVGRQQCV